MAAPGQDSDKNPYLLGSLNRGLAVLDTAEMYAEGESERVVGEALQGLRDRAFVVSKFFPHNATRRGLPLACERSLARLVNELGVNLVTRVKSEE